MDKFCKYCGGELKEGSSFCPNCGSPINGEKRETSSPSPVPSNTNPDAKSRIVAGLLGIFLGAWGVHNFYLGNTSRGIIQIVVSLVTCGLGAWWGLIEGILILCGNINTDAQGRPLV